MSAVCIKKANLKKLGYRDLEHWLEDESHVYIGRNMEFYVKGAKKSPFANPFKIGKDYTREESLELYEKYLRNSKELMKKIETLRNKDLGCWCYNEPCHANVIQKILAETK